MVLFIRQIILIIPFMHRMEEAQEGFPEEVLPPTWSLIAKRKSRV